MDNFKRLKATALAYDPQKGSAPTITAQGTGYNAKSIIQIAKEHNVPIKKDEDLINILSQIEVDQEIPEELYKAVAEIFSFIYNMSNE
jgi:flagellar biosynthesis protein